MLPDTATQTPRMMNDNNFMKVELIPFSLAALPLMPTDCVSSSREVNLKSSLNTIAMAITMSTGVGTGIPGMKLPMADMIGELKVGVAPPLIQYAMDLPQV